MGPESEAEKLRGLEREFETRLEAMQELVETMKTRRMEKNKCRDNTARALEELRAAQARVRAKLDELLPLREASRRGIAASRALRDARQGLECLTEDELNKTVAGIESRLQDKSISRSEKKNFVAQIQKLQAQRSKIRDYECKANAAASIKISWEVLDSLKQGEQELKALRSEEDTARRAHLRAGREEQEADERLWDALRQRDAAVEAKNGMYEVLRAARGARRARMARWREGWEARYRMREKEKEALDEGRGMLEMETKGRPPGQEDVGGPDTDEGGKVDQASEAQVDFVPGAADNRIDSPQTPQKDQQLEQQMVTKDGKSGKEDDNGNQDDGFLIPPDAFAKMKSLADWTTSARRLLACETRRMDRRHVRESDVQTSAIADVHRHPGDPPAEKAQEIDPSAKNEASKTLPPRRALRGPIGKAAALLGPYRRCAIGGVLLMVAVTVARFAAF